MPLSQSNLRQTPCSRKSCRNLFGPVDHEQLQSDFQDSMRKNLEEAQFKWNFDFETETPLEGAFKWERVPFPDMSSEYLCSHSKVSGENSRSTSTLKIPTKDLLNRPFSGETIQQVSEANRASSPRRLKRRQTTIKGAGARFMTTLESSPGRAAALDQLACPVGKSSQWGLLKEIGLAPFPPMRQPHPCMRTQECRRALLPLVSYFYSAKRKISSSKPNP